ncbi:MAG: hypothetical protein Q8K66_03980 [Sediminibacterium sp.]|nr:hypothetical protein [Sediminibacterium sp.]MDP3129615.1 hypothetical protein [Sediminibacterium sp.]
MNQKIKQMARLILAVVFVAVLWQTKSKAQVTQVSGCSYTGILTNGCPWSNAGTNYNVANCIINPAGTNCGVLNAELLPPQ